MKRTLHLPLLAALVALFFPIDHCAGQISNGQLSNDQLSNSQPAAADRLAITGRVTIVGSPSAGRFEPKTTIVALEPKDVNAAADRAGATHLVDMRNRTYLPGALFIRVGDSVEFRNSDPFKHNVFSLSSPNEFDLGTYPTDKSRSFTFKHPGVAMVYCNIHRKMAVFIYVSGGDWGAIARPDGMFTIPDVPPGRYTLVAWNIQGSHRQDVEIGGGMPTEFPITIDASGYDYTPHRNKYGKPYSARAAAESEFY